MDKTLGLHPTLREKITRILKGMEALGWKMIITDGVRTTEEQVALYAKGRTTVGPVVTNCDGVIKKSNHQVHPDGFGHAVDCCFLDSKGLPTWDHTYPWKLYGEAVKASGLVWGGSWVSLADLPHAELP